MKGIFIIIFLLASAIAQQQVEQHQMPSLSSNQQRAPLSSNSQEKALEQHHADSIQKPNQEIQKPRNPFQHRQADPSMKNSKRAQDQFAHKTSRNKAELMGERPRNARPRREDRSNRYKSEASAYQSNTGEDSWLDKAMDSIITRISIGLVSLFILFKICTKRSNRTKRHPSCSHSHSANTIKFSNSCFEEHAAVDDSIYLQDSDCPKIEQVSQQVSKNAILIEEQ